MNKVKMKKILSLLILSVMCLGLVAACEGSDCNPVEKTLIKGLITYADTGDEAGKALVTVTCSHDGTDYTRTAKSAKHGALKGWYMVYFPQSECIAGDKVIVEATKGDLNGKVEGLVEDFTSGKCFDLDLARVDVPLVPEFGLIAGITAVLGALGMVFVVRRK
jgi:hypothetical protein